MITSLAGYRVVRTLGRGSRAEVLLGHAGDGAVVALKVATTDDEQLDTELDALQRLHHEHIVRLLDIDASPSGPPVFVLERVGPLSLAHVLSTRPTLAAGETVTLLAPLVGAVVAMHLAGVAHGALTAARVLLRDSGAPVIIGFGRATVFTPWLSPALLGSSAPVRDDRLALARICRDVLARATGEAPEQLLLELAGWERDGFPDDGLDTLERRLYDLAPAAPVRASALEEAVPLPERAYTGEPVPMVEGAPRTGWRRRVAAIWVERVPERLRRPVWLAAAAAMLVLVGGFSVTAPAEGETEPVGAIDTAPEPSPGEQDPALALSALLAVREECIRTLSVLCLDDALDPGSSAQRDDAALIAAIEAGETSGVVADVDETSIELVERHGDAALLRYRTGPNAEPASTLLVKGEAGWRIRDVFPEDQ